MITEIDLGEDEAARHIPNEVKRLVRQRCGFGCVFCGSPVFQYDHLKDFALVREHDPANINLLCPNHHMDKTSGRLSAETVAARASNPVNLASDRSHTGMPLEIHGQTVSFDVGGNVFLGDAKASAEGFPAVQILDRPMISASWQDGWMLLDMLLTDQSGRPVIVIEKGELRASTNVWDFEIIGRRIIVRAGPRKITTILDLNEDGLNVSRGYFVYRSLAVKIEPTTINLGRMMRVAISSEPVFSPGTTLSGGHVSDSRVGLQYGDVNV